MDKIIRWMKGELVPFVIIYWSAGKMLHRLSFDTKQALQELETIHKSGFGMQLFLVEKSAGYIKSLELEEDYVYPLGSTEKGSFLSVLLGEELPF